MNPIESMWSEVKRIIQETWSVLPPRNSDELWTRGMKLLCLTLTFDHGVHDTTNEISGRSRSVSGFLIKEASF